MINIKVKDEMTKGVLTISPNATIQDAVEKMKKTSIDCLVVSEQGDVKGVLTDGDIVRKVIGEKKEPAKVKVKEIMGAPTRTVDPERNIEDAARVMRDLNIKRLPVVKNDRLVGIITETDIVKADPAIYDLIEERAKLKLQELRAKEIPLAGECEECTNYSENLKNVQGRLLCEECSEEEKQ